MRPDLRAAGIHLAEPILACFGVVLATNPPLSNNLQIALEEEQEICTGHRAASEEMGRHPAVFEVIWRVFVRKDVNKELAFGLQERVDLRKEKFIVLHVLEELDGEYTIESAFQWRGGEVIGGDIAGDNLQIAETFGACNRVDMKLLSLRVRKTSDLRARKYLGEI